MSSFIKYGIIGAGTMGQEHIKNVNLLDNAKVTSICDPNEGSLNQSSSLITNDFNSYRDLDELINNDDADAYIIATPNFTHIEVLEKNKNAIKNYLEKSKNNFVPSSLISTPRTSWYLRFACVG